MPHTTLSPDSLDKNWLRDTPPSVQAAFDALATMQLLQETADNAEAVLNAAGDLPVGTDAASCMQGLTTAATRRLVDVSRRQIETLRALLQV